MVLPSKAPHLRRVLLDGTVAGIIGGVLIDAFLYLATIAPNHGSLASLYQSIASNVVGQGAFGNSSAIWVGLLIHFCISIAWGTGFAYAVTSHPDVLSHPYVAGIVFGFVVQIVMQIVLAVSGHYEKPSAPLFAGSFLAHTLFFGLPISLYFAGFSQRPRVARNR